MTDNKPKITPPPHLMLAWQEKARNEVRDVANHFDRQSIQMIKAASWGWQQRDASVPNELQKARDEELEACCEWLIHMQNPRWAAALQNARRPKPPSLKEQALDLLDRIEHNAMAKNLGNEKAWDIKELEVVRRLIEAASSRTLEQLDD